MGLCSWGFMIVCDQSCVIVELVQLILAVVYWVVIKCTYKVYVCLCYQRYGCHTYDQRAQVSIRGLL